MTKRVQMALVGLGNVGRSLLDLISAKGPLLRER
jgi:homoserine dehydrogenase